MVLTVLVKGYFEEYCYFYVSDITRHGFIIDPGAQADKLLDIIRDNGLVIEKILLTHGHFDHFGAVEELREKLNCPVLAHEKADLFLLDPLMNLSRQCVGDMVIRDTVKFKDGDTIALDEAHSLRVIYTPGHTPDSVLLYNEKERIAFVGDTIFKESIGNYTFPGGNKDLLIQSIMERVFTLPDDTVLYSGHSEPTTVGAEKRFYGM
jgi:glyoxylase-like metal-dependent hydrolase (beta-lactamase superfamily II)